MCAQRGILALAVVVAGLGCGDDGGAPADLTGTWNATSLVFTSTTNPAQQEDLIALGATFTIVLRADGTYTSTLAPPGGAPDVATGTWSASTDVLTIQETGDPFTVQFDFSLSGSTLTLTGGGVDYDFDGDGTDDPATLDVVLVRQ